MSAALTASGLLVVSTVLPALSIVTVGLRFCARHVQNAPLKIDDWFMIPALSFYIGMAIVNIYGVKVDGYGTPAPKAAISGTTGSGIGPTAWIFDLLQVLMFGFSKLAALLFYRRVFCLQQPFGILHGTIIGMIIIVALWTIAFEILTATECGNHPWGAWTGGKNYLKYCLRTFDTLEGLSISDFLLDLIIIIIPIPKIWSLHMSVGRKISVTIVFLSALVSFGAAITRMVETLQVVTTGTSGVADSRLEVTRVAFWGMLEGGLALIAVNMPSLWSLAHRVSPEAILRSVRSIVSLRSLDSKTVKAGESAGSHGPQFEGGKASTSSETDLFNQNEQKAKLESYVMRDLDHEERAGNSNDITVYQEFSQVNNRG